MSLYEPLNGPTPTEHTDPAPTAPENATCGACEAWEAAWLALARTRSTRQRRAILGASFVARYGRPAPGCAAGAAPWSPLEPRNLRVRVLARVRPFWSRRTALRARARSAATSRTRALGCELGTCECNCGGYGGYCDVCV